MPQAFCLRHQVLYDFVHKCQSPRWPGPAPMRLNVLCNEIHGHLTQSEIWLVPAGAGMPAAFDLDGCGNFCYTGEDETGV